MQNSMLASSPIFSLLANIRSGSGSNKMAKLVVLAVLASLLGAVSCESSVSIYQLYGYPTPNPSLPPYPLPPPCSPPSAPGLQVGYYGKKCPKAEEIVRKAVKKATAGVQAGLVRLFFHDCFVRGCDASVLLNQTPGGPETEKQGFPNLSLRGFEVIDEAKKALEALKECRGVVSCADIIAFAARDASNILSYGAINYQVPAGRYDGNVSLATETLGQNLPPPFGDLNLITAMFAAKGLSQADMVALSGAHSIGRSNCSSFPDRRPPAANSSTAMEPKLADQLNKTCSAGDVNVPQDYKTPDALDIQYYKNVLSNDVLFNSDAVLESSETKDQVDRYSRDRSFIGRLLFGPQPFYRDFGEAMVKMGGIGVKSSKEGEIRKECMLVNKPY